VPLTKAQLRFKVLRIQLGILMALASIEIGELLHSDQVGPLPFGLNGGHTIFGPE